MMKKSFEPKGTVGEITGVSGTSMSLNTQMNPGGCKPMPSGGNSNPGDTKPSRESDKPVPMPK